MIRNILFTLLTILVYTATATPPEPPVGKRWILNNQFSDEFNGTSLNSSKWYDYHPTWVGRPPGIFLKSQVKVADGFMSIQGAKLPKDTLVTNWNNTKTDTFNIACGAVISKTTNASFGYYECRFKAAKTTMSTTFWMSSRKNFDGPEACNDKYGQELDFQECIGRTGNFSGSYFAEGMHSNSHFWYTGCDGIKQDLRATSVNHKPDVLPADTFYTYGGWWRDAASVSFYFEDSLTGNMNFYAAIKKNPFDQKMGLNMVSETYPFPWIELPNDAELADPNKNTCYYDWVRSYTLVDVDSRASLPTSKVFPENVWFTNSFDTITNATTIPFSLNFMSNSNRELHLSIQDENKTILYEATSKAYAGFGNKVWDAKFESKLINHKKYIAELSIRPSGSANNNNAYKTVQYQFVVQDPAQVTVQVNDERLGIALPDVTVNLGEQQAISNNMGTAFFPDLNLGNHSINASLSGYYSTKVENINITNDTVITLNLKPRNYKAYIYLKDSVTRTPIRGAKITINGRIIRTSNSGLASFNLPYGLNEMEISASDYSDQKKYIDVKSNGDINTFITKDFSEVKFIIKHNGQYFKDLDILLNNITLTTSSLGTALFKEVPVLKPLLYQLSDSEKIWKTDTASFYNDTTISIDLRPTSNIDIKHQVLQIFPNPTKTHLFLSGVADNTQYTIINLSGSICMQGQYTKYQPININQLKTEGQYILLLNNYPAQTFTKH